MHVENCIILLNIQRREKQRRETDIIPVSPKCGMSLLNEDSNKVARKFLPARTLLSIQGRWLSRNLSPFAFAGAGNFRPTHISVNNCPAAHRANSTRGPDQRRFTSHLFCSVRGIKDERPGYRRGRDDFSQPWPATARCAVRWPRRGELRMWRSPTGREGSIREIESGYVES